jgi:YHS domain-containing protein
MFTRRESLKAIAAAATLGGVVGSTGALAQLRAAAETPSPTPTHIGLKGYDPVAYFTLATATPGLAEYDYVHDGVRYFFANARHRDMFRANPDRYAPQFGGSCAMNMANGVKRESDPTIWVIINDRLYVFAGTGGAERFRQEATAAAVKATANWSKLKDAPEQ